MLERKKRKLPKGNYSQALALYKQVLAQEKDSSQKIYSLHEPDVYCMSKGKVHKKYEYGCKASLVLTQKSGIIVGAMTFATNLYDGHTLERVVDQVVRLSSKRPKTATVDRGYKGKQSIVQTQINTPKAPFQKRH